MSGNGSAVTRLVVVGDALLDRDVEGSVERLCPEAPVPVLDQRAHLARPGGAGLAAVLAAREGSQVTLVTALGGDLAGRELAALLDDAGVEVVDLGLRGETPEKVRLRTDDGRLLLRVDRGGAAGDVGAWSPAAARALAGADGVLVADYGRGIAGESGVRAALEQAAHALPLVWDPHPRGAEPVAGAALVTPNRAEARRLAAGELDDAGLATALLERLHVRAVAVTLGGRGAVLAEAGAGATLVACAPAAGGDPCGAGDRFAVAAATALAAGQPAAAAVRQAVESAAAFVAAGGAGAVASLRRPVVPAARGGASVERVRAAGGTIVATGGCFDLLHAGHVRMLEEARSLGDCLVVLLNSDESVRRLKGPDRPLVPQDDRAAVLGALASVDAVVVFEEDTPERALEQLRPHVWVKGGDYEPGELPERSVVEAAGGRVAIIPYVAGRSTTRLIEEASLLARR